MRSSRRGGGAFFVLLVGHAIAAAPAFADDATTRVTVIRPAGGDVVLIEIATRAWAELTAGGVAAILMDCVAADESCGAAPPPAGGRAITLTTFRRAEETITEATLTPHGHDRPTVRRSLTVSDEAATNPKVMAIRAVELVNAMMLQLDSAAIEGAAGARRGVIGDAEFPGQHQLVDPASPGDHDPSWSLGAGASFLKGPGGLGAAYGFAIRASYQIHNRVGVSAILTEAPSPGGVPTLDGNLSMNQQLAAIEVTCRVYRRGRVASHVAFGGGGYHVSASWTGRPVSTVVPADSTSALWALLLSGGGGAVVAIGREVSLFLEARAVIAAPNPIVYGTDGRALKTADPSLLMSLGLQRTF